jgi:hypothetical protein
MNRKNDNDQPPGFGSDQDAPKPAPAEPNHHPLDDDAELEHIARFSPPEIEVGPDSDSRVGRDLPPPMIRPPAGVAVEKPVIDHIAPLGPLAEREAPANEPLHPVAKASGRKIRAFDQKLGGANHEDNWKRTPNVTGTGAIHVKSFHCKLTGDSLEFLDRQVNEWLDAHPQYEVKQVTTSVGEWSGKMKEPALIVNVWV